MSTGTSKSKSAAKGAKNAGQVAQRFAGQSFVVSGKFDYRLPPERVKELLTYEGAKIQDELDTTTRYLVQGQTRAGTTSTAEKKALQLNAKGASIQVLDRDGLLDLIALDGDAFCSWLRAGTDAARHAAAISYLLCANGKGLVGDGADLQGVTLSDIPNLNIPRANLSKSKLSNVRFDSADSVSFDEAVLDKVISYQSPQATFRKAKLSEVTLGHCDGADFTQAKISKANFHHSGGKKAVFDQAELRETEFRHATFPQASFCNTRMTEVSFVSCDLTGADFTGASLEGVDFRNANLTKADFSKANLRGAQFNGAKLTQARVEGADFQDAIFAGANLDQVEVSTAKNLVVPPARGKLGPAVKALDAVAKKANRIQFTFTIDTPAREWEVVWESYHGRHLAMRWTNAEGRMETTYAAQFSPGLVDLVNTWWADGTPRLETITSRSTKSSVTGKDLTEMVVAAVCEAFGVEPPSEEELKKQKQSAKAGQSDLRQAAIDDLKQGAAGVKKFNALSASERAKLGNFRKVELTGAKLAGVNLCDLDLQGANLEKANLTKATLLRSILREARLAGANLQQSRGENAGLQSADLTGANLSKATFDHANFSKANLTGAIFKQASLKFAILSGANLTQADLAGAKFERTQYDEKTQWPAGFEVSLDMLWAGAGVDPAQRKHVEAQLPKGPIDMETFMELLGERTDKSRLDKATKMLKAEKFQLFADVKSDSLAGIVKSQNDPDLVYSCRLTSEGAFACCTQNLNPCGGLRGALCKHLLVLIVGLTKGSQLDPTEVNKWVASSRLHQPALNKDVMTEILLKYKGAQAGELDWRPTETVPEDFYAF